MFPLNQTIKYISKLGSTIETKYYRILLHAIDLFIEVSLKSLIKENIIYYFCAQSILVFLWNLGVLKSVDERYVNELHELFQAIPKVKNYFITTQIWTKIVEITRKREIVEIDQMSPLIGNVLVMAINKKLSPIYMDIIDYICFITRQEDEYIDHSAE